MKLFQNRNLLAVLARPDSLVGVSFDGSDDLKLVCVTKPLHQIAANMHVQCKTRKKQFLPGDTVLEGKILNPLSNHLAFSFNHAKVVTFTADEVFTSSIQHEVTRKTRSGDPLIVTLDEELTTSVTSVPGKLNN